MGNPVKVEEKWWKGSVALLKESIQLGCASQDFPPRKSILREAGKIGTWHHVKIRERQGPLQGVLQKCELQERNLCAPKFDERTRDETLKQERFARREA